MWQKVDDKYHWALSGDPFQAPTGSKVRTYCRMIVRVQRNEQVAYVREDRCEFCDGVANIIHTAAYEAIQYSVRKETRVDVLRRALEFSRASTLTKAIEREIRKLEKAM